MSTMSGPQVELVQMLSVTPFDTKKDFDDYIARLNAVPKYIDQTISLLEEGIRINWVQPYEGTRCNATPLVLPRRLPHTCLLLERCSDAPCPRSSVGSHQGERAREHLLRAVRAWRRGHSNTHSNTHPDTDSDTDSNSNSNINTSARVAASSSARFAADSNSNSNSSARVAASSSARVATATGFDASCTNTHSDRGACETEESARFGGRSPREACRARAVHHDASRARAQGDRRERQPGTHQAGRLPHYRLLACMPQELARSQVRLALFTLAGSYALSLSC